MGVCCKSACLICKRLQTGKEDITTTSIIQVKIYQTQIYGRLLLLELAQLMLIAACQIQIGFLAQIEGYVFSGAKNWQGKCKCFSF